MRLGLDDEATAQLQWLNWPSPGTAATRIRFRSGQPYNKALRSDPLRHFNRGMKVKIFTCTVLAGCMLGSITFGQTIKVTGIVCSFNDTQITLQCGQDTWIVKTVEGSTSVEGMLKVGSKVTVECKSPDAQRKEGVTTCTPAPTPKSTPKV